MSEGKVMEKIGSEAAMRKERGTESMKKNKRLDVFAILMETGPGIEGSTIFCAMYRCWTLTMRMFSPIPLETRGKLTALRFSYG